ncbi:MAG: hypothetical protein ACKKMP_03555 [Candidatus Nealsonbacteria bacterium]
MLEVVKRELKKSLPTVIVSELLKSYREVKNNFYLNHFRPNEVEGGRFAEAVFRILEHRLKGRYTPLGKQVDTNRLIAELQSIPFGQQPESIRLHIPRTLRVIYDIRSKRDAAHLADGINPNVQDTTFVVAACDWVMAELVRLYHSVSPSEAQKIVEELVERKLLVVQDFDGFLKTLNPSWGPKERILTTLYQRGKKGATVDELASWLKPSQRKNIKAALYRLEYNNDFIFCKKNKCFITYRGLKYVEDVGILLPK